LRQSPGADDKLNYLLLNWADVDEIAHHRGSGDDASRDAGE
jgi:hypothetical protein